MPSLTQQIIQLIRPIYEQVKSAISEVIGTVILVLNTFNDIFAIFKDVGMTIQDFFTTLTNMNLHIGTLEIPGAIGRIPGIGDIAKAFASLVNPVINTVNTIFSFIQTIAKIVKAVVTAGNQVISLTIQFNTALLNGLLYFKNNPGVVLYLGMLMFGFIMSLTPIGMVGLSFLKEMPIIWIISGALFIFSPLIIYIYLRFNNISQVSSGNGIDMLVVNTEDTLLFTDRGSEIFYPILYLLSLGGFYGVLLSEFCTSFLIPNLPLSLVITINLLPIIPVVVYLYYFLPNPSVTLRTWIAGQFNLLVEDARFDAIKELKDPSQFMTVTSDNLRAHLKEQFGFTDEQLGKLDQIQILRTGGTGNDTLGFLGTNGKSTIKAAVQSVLTIPTYDSHWAAVSKVITDYSVTLIADILVAINNTFNITDETIKQMIKAQVGTSLGFLQSGNQQLAFKQQVQQLTSQMSTPISSSDDKWTTVDTNPLHAVKIQNTSAVTDATTSYKTGIGILKNSLANSIGVAFNLNSNQSVDANSITDSMLPQEMVTELKKITRLDQVSNWLTKYNYSTVTDMTVFNQVKITTNSTSTDGTNTTSTSALASTFMQTVTTIDPLTHTSTETQVTILSQLQSISIDLNANEQNQLINAFPNTLFDSTTHLNTLTTKTLFGKVRDATIATFGLTTSTQQNLIPSVPIYLFLTDSGAFLKYQQAVSNALSISPENSGWDSVFTKDLSQMKSTEVKEKILEVFQSTLIDIQKTALDSISILNISSPKLSAIGVKNSVALMESANFLAETANIYLGLYLIAVGLLYNFLPSSFIQSILELLPAAVGIIAQVIPVLPGLAWLFLVFVQKIEYKKAIFLVIDSLTFKNDYLALIYPIGYSIGLYFYYQIIGSELFTKIVGEVSTGVTFMLYTLPVLPLIDYVYRMLTLNQINLVKAGLMGILDTNGVVSVNQVRIDFTNWVNLLTIAYLYGLRFYYGFLRNESIMSELPLILVILLQVLPLIPIILYLYARFVLQEGHSNAMSLVLDTISFKNYELSLFYPIAYLTIFATYCIFLVSLPEMISQFIPGTVLFILFLTPMLPMFIYLYRFFQPSMPYLCNKIAAQIGVPSAKISAIPSLQSLAAIDHQSSSSIKIQIIRALSLDGDQAKSLDTVPYLQVSQLTSTSLKNSLTIGATIQDLFDKYNLSIYCYLLFIRTYSELMGTELVTSIKEAIDAVIPISMILTLIPIIPLLSLVVFIILDQQITRAQLTKNIDFYLNLFGNSQTNQDVLGYTLVSVLSLSLLLFSQFMKLDSDTNTFIKVVLMMLLIFLLFPLVIFISYFANTGTFGTSISNTRNVVRVLIDLNVIKYLSTTTIFYGLYFSSYLDPLLNALPGSLKLVVQLSLLFVLVPLLVFIYHLFLLKESPGDALFYSQNFFSGNLLSSMNFRFSVRGSAVDRNPTLTPLEKCFFSMLYGENPQSAYYSPDQAVLSQVTLSSKTNFTQRYSLKELNLEFFGAADYQLDQYSNYQAQQMTRFEYIQLPLVAMREGNQVQTDLQSLITGLIGDPQLITDQMLVDYANGYDANNRPFVIPRAPTGDQQGLRNSNFILDKLSELRQTYLDNDTAYAEAMNRLKAYIAHFGKLLGTSYMRVAGQLQTCIYRTETDKMNSIIQSQVGVNYILESSQAVYMNNLFNAAQTTLFKRLNGANTGSLSGNPELFYKVILANVPVDKIQSFLVDQRSFAVKYLFQDNNGIPFNQVYSLTPTATLETEIYNQVSAIAKSAANSGRTLIQSIATQASSDLPMTVQLDPYIMQNFYDASVLLNQVYGILYKVCGKFNPNAKSTDALDLISFRGSVSKFDWPTSNQNDQSKRYVSITQLKLDIINACKLDSSAVSDLDTLSIFKDPLLVKNNAIDILTPGLLDKLTGMVLGLYKRTPAAAFQVDVVNALQLSATDALKLASIPELQTGMIDVSDSGFMTNLKAKIATSLGLNDGASLRNKITIALNLTQVDMGNLLSISSINAATVNILDNVTAQNIQTDLINFIASSARIMKNVIAALSLNGSEQSILSSLTVLQANSVDLTNPNLKAALQLQIINAFKLNQTSTIKDQIVSTLGLNAVNAAKLSTVVELSGTTVDIFNTNTTQSIKAAVRGLFPGGSFISTNQIKQDLTTAMQLTGAEVAALSTVTALQSDTVSVSSLTQVRDSIITTLKWNDTATIKQQVIILFNLSTGNQATLNGISALQSSTISIMTPGVMGAVKSAISTALSFNSSMANLLENIRGLSQKTFDALDLGSKYVNIDLVDNVRSLKQITGTTLAFPEIQSQSQILTALSNIREFSGLSRSFTFSNNQSVQLVTRVSTGMGNLPSINQNLIQQLSNQDDTSLTYWLNGMKRCKNNWLALYNVDLDLDPVSGKPKEIGYQTGCPKSARENLYSQYVQILAGLEVSLTNPAQGDLLNKLSQIVDLLALPCQFFYFIKAQSSGSDQYIQLLQVLSEAFVDFIDFKNETFSLFGLLSPQYEYAHFVINLPLNLNPLILDSDFASFEDLSTAVSNNLYQNAEYQNRKAEIIRSFVIKVLLDMVWWQDFVLWYYPLPEKVGKDYVTSGSRLNYSYTDTSLNKNRVWNSQVEACNRFKYTSSAPTLSPVGGTYLGSNGVISSTLRLKQNPGVWIGNGCIGYGMHQIFAEWSVHFQNNLVNMVNNADYPNLKKICLSGDLPRYVCAYKHDLIVGYVFITTAPFTYNRFNGAYSWRDLRQAAFVADMGLGQFPQPVLSNQSSLYKIMYTENRQIEAFNSQDEYINSLTGVIPSVYFNSNVDGPANAPKSPLFQRSCIDNLDFGNSIFHGRSSLSKVTPLGGYGSLGYRYIYDINSWPFNAAQNPSAKNDIITNEGRYYFNSFDWLVNRSCIGSNLTMDSTDSHLLKPATLTDLWGNPQKFLQAPIGFLNLDRSYQFYPLQMVSDPDYCQVYGEGDAKPTYFDRPDLPEFYQVGWVIPSGEGTVPYAQLVITNWTKRFKSK